MIQMIPSLQILMQGEIIDRQHKMILSAANAVNAATTKINAMPIMFAFLALIH